jgi:hypothetical protein
VKSDIFEQLINWAAKIEIYLIGVSVKSIQSHGFRFGKSGISIGDIPSIFALRLSQ